MFFERLFHRGANIGLQCSKVLDCLRRKKYLESHSGYIIARISIRDECALSTELSGRAPPLCRGQTRPTIPHGPLERVVRPHFVPRSFKTFATYFARDAPSIARPSDRHPHTHAPPSPTPLPTTQPP